VNRIGIVVTDTVQKSRGGGLQGSGVYQRWEGVSTKVVHMVILYRSVSQKFFVAEYFFNSVNIHRTHTAYFVVPNLYINL
jgi:hypothetical protein